MKTIAIAAVAAAFTGSAQVAWAANDLILVNLDEFANAAIVNIEGNSNRLQIVQDHFGGAAGNTISVSIEGDLNGGPLDAEFTGAARRAGLEPGMLVQEGFGNAMSFRVNGSNNLFAAAQIGNSNTIDAFIQGSYNQASVMQVGNGNFAAFSQNGIGNIVSISQTSW